MAIYTKNNSSYSFILESYIHNLRFNTSTTPKPLLIVTALHESHIKASIVCAQMHGLEMKIRSGGHDYEGLSYVAHVPFFILDMFNLRSIDINIEEETAWVQAGATLGELYYQIFQKSKTHGFPASVCPTVGVGGHFSGGGYGNMMRKYGLSADHIIDAQLVDVNGRLLNRTTMGEDLFWAIRGGGAASFGVILAYKIKLVRVPKIVTVFNISRTIEQNALDIVLQWQDVAPYKLDHDLFIRLTMKVVNNKTIQATFLALFLGDSQRLLSIMNESLPKLGVQQSDCQEMSWVESVLFYTNFPTGTPVDTLLSRTPQKMYVTYLKRKSDYVKEPIPREGLEGIWKKMIEIRVTALTFNPYGGRMAEIPEDEIPFPHRAGIFYKFQYATSWIHGGDEVAKHNIDMTRELHAHMTPFVSKSPRRHSFCYRDIDLGINHQDKRSYCEGMGYGIKYFKDNFYRLVQIKTKVDPHNFFRNEQSIPTLPTF
ncbi:hypothetical protein Nepgr_003271 [Nepenthes gracilis]|uniref:FAD-binding PCMH-type domain-containing protein n=1 Tax=Nepenthes gracilis TaxID=150966 RepID=A0AAD3RZ86_NEPGR|nr:hypothetical protein Nepgr_003271 [Nepenthes gracilis]